VLRECGVRVRGHGIRGRIIIHMHRRVETCVHDGGGDRSACRAKVHAEWHTFVACVNSHGIDRAWLRAHLPLDDAERATLHSAVSRCRTPS
jgi:hypothetical protein